ncbi:hemagglutinin repeat-containing protein [Amphibiibacter pelophylacis]|uniref:Hemagglutinin repeat-containing protein n=1 Tax=Amphibiibacter pelophylacis TaxID=1799477 RepID=A0ACC6P464_9BURK
MNRHLHRLVFSRRHGQLVAVAESATAQGKSAGQTSGRTSAGSAVARLALASVLALAPLAQALAQVVADPSAPKTQQATVLAAPNGVPLVNIQTPSSAGVSRNTYQQFDVQGNGVILNNSRGNVQTQQGGWVQGNPWLARGEAKIILNEVNSSNPSQIRGYIEVGGQRAEVIVANPAGIQVDGGGFINASRATLVTGQVQTGESGLQGYTVSGGTITIDGRGLDASLTDYTGLLAQAVKANAGVWAKQLQVVTGHNQISADTSLVQATPAASASSADGPAFALDVSSLGGMYAGKITLLGTQAGLGMRNAGQIGASAGELVVRADGRLENTGTLQGQGGVDIATGSLANGGQILSPQQVKVQTAADLGNAGGSMQAQRLELASGGGIDNTGGTLAQTTAGLSVTARTVDNSQGQFGTPQQATDTGGAVTPSRPSGGSGSGTEGGTTASGSGSATGSATGSGTAAGGTAVAAPLPPGVIQAAGALVNQGGKVESGGAVSLQTQALDNRQGQMRLDSLQVSGGTLDNSAGQITAAGDVTVAGQSVDSHDGSIQAQNIRLSARQGVSLGGSAQLAARQTLSVDAAQVDSSGTLRSGGDTAIRADGPVNSSGQVYAGGNLAITSLGTVTNTGVAGAAGDTTVTAARLTSHAGSTLAAGLQADGRLAGNGRLQTSATGQTTLQGSTLSAGDQSHSAAALDVSGGDSQVSGRSVTLEAKSGGLDASAATVTAAQTLKATTPGLLDTRGASVSAAQLDLAAQALDNDGGRLSQSGSGDMTLDLAGTLSNRQGVLESSGRNLTLKAAALDSTAGRITHSTADASGQLAITTQSLDGAGATIQGNGGVSLQARLARLGGATTTAVGALDIGSQTLDASGGTLQGDSIRLGASQALTLGGSAQVSAVKGLQIDAGQVDSGGTLRSGGDTAIQASGPVSNAGQVYAGGNLAITSTGAVTNTGLAGSAGDTTVTAARITSTAGSTLAAGLQADGRVPADSSATLRTRASADTVLAGAVLATGTQEHSAAALDVGGNTLQARDIRLQARTGAVSAAGASLTATGTLALQAATRLDTQGATATAGQLELAAHDISNAGGRLQQSGSAATTISLPGRLDNSGGVIASNGSRLSVTAQGLSNAGGAVRGAAVDITTRDLLDNGAGGTLRAAGSLDVKAGQLASAGSISAGGDVTVTSAGDLSQSGQMVSDTGRVQASAGGTLHGAAGSLTAAAGDVSLTAGRIAQDAGSTLAAGLAGDGSIQAGRGTLATAAMQDSHLNGTLASGAGQQHSGASVDLAGASLTGQSARVQASAGDADASGSRISAAQGVSLQAAGTVRTAGASVSGQDVSVSAQSLDSQGGTLQAAGTLSVAARDVNNTDGRLLSSATTAVTATGVLDNTRGLISSQGTVSVVDPQAQASRTLVVTNTGGTLIAGQDAGGEPTGLLKLQAAKLGLDGQVLSLGDMDVSLLGDQTFASGSTPLQANGSLSLTTTGRLTNGGLLQPGRDLTVTAQDVDNQAGGVLSSGRTTHLAVAGTLTNRGQIDGGLTHIEAGTLANTGTGLIMGNRVAVAAGTVDNSAEGGKAATIASRGDLDIGAATLRNRDGAELLALNDLTVGGALGDAGRSTGKAGTVSNQSARILAQNNLSLTAESIENKNIHFKYSISKTVSKGAQEYILSSGKILQAKDVAWSKRYDPSECFFGQCGFGANGGIYPASGAYADIRFKGYYFGPDAYTPPYLSVGDHDTNLPARFSYRGDSPIWSDLGVKRPKTDGLAPNMPTGEDNGTTFTPASDLAIATWLKEVQPWLDLQNRINQFRKEVQVDLLSGQTPYNQFDVQQDVLTIDPDSEKKAAVISSGANLMLSASSRLENYASKILAKDISIAGSSLDNSGPTVSLATKVINGFTYEWAFLFKSCDPFCDDVYGWKSQAYSPPAVYKETEVGVIPLNGDGGGIPVSPNFPAPGESIPVKDLAPVVGVTSIAASVHAGKTTDKAVSAAVIAVGQTVGTSLPGVTSAVAPLQAGASATSTVPPSGAFIRTVTTAATLPASSLFAINPAADNKPLVETNPAFTQYSQWLSSDYMLKALAIDPATTQKRLGDGFYEQRLINEQVAQLTGRRYLGDYTTDDGQYRALMDNGATFAKAQQLRPGIALTAAQIAQLTSDIVWLVAQDVKLPDGTTTQALVPQVYARVQPGDIDGSGALISGDTLKLNVSGGLVNSGTLAGRRVVDIRAGDVTNLGRITGQDVGVKADRDIAVTGGTVDAQDSLKLDAGRNLAVASTTVGGSSQDGPSSHSYTALDRVAGLYVTGSGATRLQATAGQDIQLTAVQVAHAGGAGSTTLLQAGGDLTLDAVRTGRSQSIVWDADNHLKASQSQDVGTTVQAAGDIALKAGGDISGRAATVSSSAGAVTADGRDVKLAAGESSSSFDQAQRHTSSGFLSSTTIASRTTSDQTKAVASELSGRTVAINASRDVAVTGSNILSDAGTGITAGRNVDITAAAQNNASSSDYSKRSSGLLGGGGLGFTIGTRSQSSAQKQAGDTAAGSVIGSTGGNVSIQAGQTYTQTGSDVLAPKGDIGIQAKKVDITEARERRSDSSEQKFSQSGITVALSVPVIEAVQGVTQMANAVQDTRSARMQAMGTAMAAVKASDALDAAKATAQSLNDGKVPDGVSLSVSLGSSKSRSSSTSSSESGRGSTLAAGGNIAIQATGGGQGSDLTVRGSSIQSGGDIALKADNRVRVLGSQDETQQGGSDSSGSAAIGLSVGLGEQSAGLSLTLAASRALGHRNGSATTQQDSTVAAGKTLTIDSGGDTDILGGTASGETVKARVGGNLNLASLQDTAKFKEDSKNAGFNASIPIPGMSTGTASASLSAGKTALRSDYASTQTTSGIKSGDGGFDVQVKGKTTLDGAVIASSDAAVAQGRNRFRSEGRTELKDITNSAKYSADSVSVGVGISGAASKDTGAQPVQKSGPALNGAGLGSDSGSAGSVTQAGISGIAGDTSVRSGDVGSGIKPIFDADTVRADVNAQGVITKEFGPVAAKEWGTLADHLALEAQKEGRTEDAEKWREGGTYRAAGHAVLGGLTGGTAGAVGASASSLAAPVLGGVQSKLAAGLASAGLSDKLAQSLAGATVATAAGVTGAVAGGTAAGTAALNQDANNRQLHPDEVKLIDSNAARYALRRKISREEAIKELAQQAARQADATWSVFLGSETDTAAKLFLKEIGAGRTFTNDEGNQQPLFTAGAGDFANAMRGASYARSSTEVMDLYRRDLQPDAAAATPGQIAANAGTLVKDGAIEALSTLPGAAAQVILHPIDTAKAMPGAVVDGFSQAGQSLGGSAAIAFDDASRQQLIDLYGSNAAPGIAATAGALPAAAMVLPSTPAGKIALKAGGKILVDGAEAAVTAGNKVLDAAAVAFETNKIRNLEQVTMSAKGTISAQKITLAGTPAALNEAELSKLSGLGSLDSNAAGALREEVTDSYFRRNGFTALDGKCGAGNKNCFDGVYVKNGQVYINEVKPIGSKNTISLSGNSSSPNDIGVQMTKEWIDSRLDELFSSGDPVKIKTANIILDAIKSKNLVKTVSGVRPDGITTLGIK